MYSVVILMALSNGAATPACHCGGCGWYGGCWSGYACGYGGGCGYAGGGAYWGGYGYENGHDRRSPYVFGTQASAPVPATRARIVVSLPADATLTIADSPTTSTTGTRVFLSPDLEPGKDFYYTLRGEMVRHGAPVTASKQVKIRAGEETRVTLDFPAGNVARK